ncbi:unnamed protein product [Acanthoscelides obtectus]|uniref:Uncharacterized protein n=1 Tax=Acanthoscelides obtectus TaxID=200917 RepID=A0A9P0JN93_ACAOB|nr:unnamed protein product [Acanthoscelides obtectus]CAK1624946.1 Protein mitoshell [Acanthoscelides obtectus]
MEQNRSENSTNQQQNVHLHMHHVCNCQGNVFPTYYPAVGYRSPVPPLVTYQAPPVPRSYLQHYQYTQFNMGSGGQYSVPITHHVAPPASAMYSPASAQTGLCVSGYDYTQVTPPASELLLGDNSESATPENFVKFLEKSCLTAEQIAYRNRNRPCFRNIQNLCIRTRSEILKPCTTISNIHSQGIPWATKDFIYAFVRLTNCWHILKGYWENRDGSSLGKIEKELTPEFRACYVRWEKETIELAGQLTRVFYNLDTNLVSPHSNSVKTSPPDLGTTKKCQTSEDNSISSSTLTNLSLNNPAKNVRGIIHLPPTPVVTETVDQANQTYSADFFKDEAGYDSEEERRVYMKPGSYNVPKKGSNEGGNITSPREIEFLETAQNIKKAHTMANDRYWSSVGVSNKKSSGDVKIVQDIPTEAELDLNLTAHMNVHEWLLTSNFSDFGEQSPTSTQELRTFD